MSEQQNILEERPSQRPIDFGQTVIARAIDLTAEELLSKIREVWSVVATWGRWCDEQLGEWPSSDECIRALPTEFRSTLDSVPPFEIENWLQDLHDRTWIWWSSAVVDGFVKIDLAVESMPSSFWTVEFVIERLGGEVIRRGNWRAFPS